MEEFRCAGLWELATLMADDETIDFILDDIGTLGKRGVMGKDAALMEATPSERI